MNYEKFSLILSYRNRDFDRLVNCISSLLDQTYSNFEVILVDYGSKIELLERIESYFELLPDNFHLICHAGQGHFWNRSHALNIGANKATGTYLIFGDIDMIYPNGFISSVNKFISPSAFLNYQCFYLNKRQSNMNLNEIRQLDDSKRIFKSSENALGLMVISRSVFFEVGAFDEFYSVWGFEDNDLGRKLIQKGISQKWLSNEKERVYHQWHALTKPLKKPTLWYLTMGIHFFSANNENNSPDLKLGSILCKTDRKIFQFEPIEKRIILPIISSYDYWNAFFDAFHSIKEGNIIEIIHKPVHYKGRNKIFRLIDNFITSKNLRKFMIKSFGILSSRDYLSEIDIFDFFSWFINAHKILIEDYNFELDNGTTTVKILKK